MAARGFRAGVRVLTAEHAPGIVTVVLGEDCMVQLDTGEVTTCPAASLTLASGVPKEPEQWPRGRSTPGDGIEPPLEDVHEYTVIPEHGSKRPLHVRTGVIYERDPEKARRLEQRQNAAIMEALRWVYDHQDELRAKKAERDAADEARKGRGRKGKKKPAPGDDDPGAG